MNTEQYIELARRTLKMMPTFRQHMIHMALGLTGEFGELIDAFKKVLVYGKPYDHTNAIEEVGDVLWYLANLMPELMVEPGYMNRALGNGTAQGYKLQQEVKIWDDFRIGEFLLQLNKAVASRAEELGRLHHANAPGTSAAVSYIETFASNVGVLCGLLGIDYEMAMERNIEKLAKRYGDKYSDYAAINRDTDAERVVLEGAPASPTIEVEGSQPANAIYTFEEFLDYGRGVCTTSKVGLVGGMPWAFRFYDAVVTHQTDTQYIFSFKGASSHIFSKGQGVEVRDGKVYGFSEAAA